jgi:hypothetical protein
VLPAGSKWRRIRGVGKYGLKNGVTVCRFVSQPRLTEERIARGRN